jgi:site-specific recombinase XerD
MDLTVFPEPMVQFTFVKHEGRLSEIATNHPAINHFLELIRLNRAYNTWLNYGHDLKLFFRVIAKPPESVTRADCLTFMKHQAQAGCSAATINRRLAAVSSLFNELQLLEPERYPQNPVSPHHNKPGSRQARFSLYRKQAQRVPDIIAEADLHTFLNALPTWRDRTLVLLMWISCLRIGEAVAIRFQDIECSRRSIWLPKTKGDNPRTVFMDDFTFAALNRYLDQERGALFPEEDHIFVAFKGKARGRPLSVNAVQKMLRYYGERCQLPRLHAHLFRHTGITHLLQHGMPEPVIRQLVGHRHPDSLLPYLHLTDTFVETEFEQAQLSLNLATWFEAPVSGGAS